VAEHGYDGYRQLSEVLKRAYADLPDERFAESDPDGSVHSYAMGHTTVEGEYHDHSSSDGTAVTSSGSSTVSGRSRGQGSSEGP
jgi:hypothetical protein